MLKMAGNVEIDGVIKAQFTGVLKRLVPIRDIFLFHEVYKLLNLAVAQ